MQHSLLVNCSSATHGGGLAMLKGSRAIFVGSHVKDCTAGTMPTARGPKGVSAWLFKPQPRVTLAVAKVRLMVSPGLPPAGAWGRTDLQCIHPATLHHPMATLYGLRRWTGRSRLRQRRRSPVVFGVPRRGMLR
eukprot:5336556-Prymnesium_polylepis.1